jgi:hypothetical protein
VRNAFGRIFTRGSLVSGETCGAREAFGLRRLCPHVAAIGALEDPCVEDHPRHHRSDEREHRRKPRNQRRHRRAGAAPTMPLMPLMRPFNNKSSAAARPMSKPPISPLTGVKFSIVSSLAS